MNATGATPEKRGQPPKGWPARFLEVLAQTANVWATCRVVGVHRATAYRRRSRDPKFKRDWDLALEDSYDALELAVRKRAQSGSEKPIYEKRRNPDGSFTMVKVDTVYTYHDTLAMFLLKAYRPEKFRENFDYGNLIRDYERSVQSKGPGPARGDRR
jgi:hypothetical protein